MRGRANDEVGIANTKQVKEEAAGDGWKTLTFANTQPLPTYLVAFGVGPYSVVDARPAGVNKVPMLLFTPRNRGAEAAFAARVLPEILETPPDSHFHTSIGDSSARQAAVRAAGARSDLREGGGLC